MPSPHDHTTTYDSTRIDGNAIAILGNVQGNIHFPERPREAGKLLRHQCLRDLRVTDPREDRARIEADKDRLLRDCYAWVLDDASFQQWRTQDESRLLWIKGDPGKGKTMMTMGVIAELSRREETKQSIWNVIARLWPVSGPCLLAYFFCQSTRPELSNATSVLRGLIYLLIAQKEELMHYVQKRYEMVGKQLFEGPNAVYALREILSDMLDDASLPLTYLLVDALDECASGLSELLHVITDSSIGRRSQVKWLVTSRNIPEIERHLQPDLLGVKISLEVKAIYVSRAVATFIEYKVQRLAAIQKYEPRLRAEVQQQLRNKAENTFLWVSLVCKELEKVPLYRTREVLHAMPTGLDPLYDRMMAQILGQDDVQTAGYCKAVLGAVSIAFRPLRLGELVVVASLPSDKFDHPQTVADLVSHCGSCLTVREGVVSFIHLSAKDYFTVGSGGRVLGSTLAHKHGQMADRLLDAMDSMLRRDLCGLQQSDALTNDESTQELIKSSDLMKIAYACEHWIDHMQAGRQSCSSTLADSGKVRSFFEKHLLHWLEVISLLKKMPEAIQALQKLETDLKRAGSTAVSNIVHDALRFTMWAGPGSQEAPLQLYYGALVFAPEQSFVRQQFTRELPEGVRVRSGLQEDWGPLLQTLDGHKGYVTTVAFSAEGDRLASASDKTVRVWDAKTGQPLHTLEGHTNGVNNVAFSTQGDRLASASWDKTVRVWDAKTRQLLHTLEGHTSCVNSVAFSVDGDRLASASWDKTVRVWDTKTGQSLHMLEGHTSYVMSVAFLAKSNQLASASYDKTVRVWDTNTEQPVHTLEGHTNSLESIAVSADGDRLASASGETVRVWDTKTGQSLHTLEGHTGRVTSVAFSAHGDRLASASGDMTVRLWNAKTGLLLYTFKGHTSQVNSVAFSTQGDRLASASSDETVRVWDTNTGQSLHPREGHTDGVNSVAFSADGDRLASASNDMTVRVWDTKTGQPLHMLEGHTSTVNGVVFSTQDDRLASASSDNTVRVWDARTKELLYRLEGHTSFVLSVAFSVDGDRLASASGDTTVRLWNAKTGEALYTLKGHTGRVNIVVFSAEGDRLASASADGTVRVWDAKTGQPLHTLEHVRRVSSMTFSQDGSHLLTDRGTLLLPQSMWSASTHSPQASAKIVFVTKRWLTVNTEDVLWIPADYQPSCTAVHSCHVAFGHSSGRVLLLEVAEPHFC